MSNGLTLPFVGNATLQGKPAFTINNPPGNGILGTSQGGSGVVGTSQGNHGVLGTSPGGIGVYGVGGGSAGVYGEATNTNGSGVLGSHASGGKGVSGFSDNFSGTGVYGNGATGVYGSTTSQCQPGPGALAGVWGENLGSGPAVKGTSQGGDGVVGFSSAKNHAGVSAVNEGGGYGVYASSSGYGVWASGAPAGHFEGDVAVTGDINVTGDLFAEALASSRLQTGVLPRLTTYFGPRTEAVGFTGTSCRITRKS